MRTTIVPAQITTVEDKIAGNLNFTQILLLLAALFSATIVYAFFPIRLQLTAYKIPVVLLLSGMCLTLAVRIKGKVLVQWLVIIATYATRPQFYVFNKNDLTSREGITEETVRKEKAHWIKQEKVLEKTDASSIPDLVALEKILLDPNSNVRFALGRKGGIDVTVSQAQ